MKLGPIICWETNSQTIPPAILNKAQPARSYHQRRLVGRYSWTCSAHAILWATCYRNGKDRAKCKYGISCIIDQKGRVHEPLGWEEEGVIVMEVPLLEGQTLYSKTGDWIGQFMVWLFALNLGILLFSRFFRLKPR